MKDDDIYGVENKNEILFKALTSINYNDFYKSAEKGKVVMQENRENFGQYEEVEGKEIEEGQSFFSKVCSCFK